MVEHTNVNDIRKLLRGVPGISQVIAFKISKEDSELYEVDETLEDEIAIGYEDIETGSLVFLGKVQLLENE